MLPFENTDPTATLVGRVWRPEIGPCLITLRGDEVIDITSKSVPTMRDLLELDDPATYVRDAVGESLGSLTDLAHLSGEASSYAHGRSHPVLLSRFQISWL